MSRQHPLTLVIVLSLLAIGGIIGMLLAESGLLDGIFFALAALPLLIGLMRLKA